MKIVLAMSGGIDSACAGLILRRSGHEVIGVTMLIDGFPPAPAMDEAIQSCCKKLQITHHYLDVSEVFKREVVIPAAQSYAAGFTPNPCSLCNPAVKFGELLKFTRQTGAERLATGHYVRLGYRSNKTFLRRGADRAKDQSYFLALLPEETAQQLLFPLGELTKPVIRVIAADAGFNFKKSDESEELCFVPPGVNAGDELFRRAGLSPRPGKIYYRNKCVGHHQGIHRITLGQRQGLGVALGVPAFVKSIDGVRHSVELETDSSTLMRDEFFLVARENAPMPQDGDYEIQIRYRSRPVHCTLSQVSSALYRVRTAAPLRAVTPGQIGALYRGEELCGGGIINLGDDL